MLQAKKCLPAEEQKMSVQKISVWVYVQREKPVNGSPNYLGTAWHLKWHAKITAASQNKG